MNEIDATMTVSRRAKLRPSALFGAVALFAAAATFALFPTAEAKAAAPYSEAVLLVSGFETESPFTTPAAKCVGREGSEWNPPGYPAGSDPEGLAPVLKHAGNNVFTAPVTKSSTDLPASCSGDGEPLPDFTKMTVISNGDTDDNGVRLGRLIGFLRDNYGVTKLRIVGHSDGGLWSRAAITKDSSYQGVDIQSLTTLGTPHTGSFLADLAWELKNGKCDFSNRTEQKICYALVITAKLIVAKLGAKATFQLTNDFLATWNPKQSIGNCPVSAIAGNHIDLPLPLPGYYMPSDGLVGIASAQATRSFDITGHPIPAPVFPDLREAGVYDAVHGGSLGFLYGKTLLNQAQISQQVSESILLDGPSPCNLSPAAVPAQAGTSAPASLPTQRLRAPLYRMVATSRKGRLPKPGPEDFAMTRRGVSVYCGFTPLKGVPLLGDRRMRIHSSAGCNKRMRVHKSGGKGAARALMLRSNPNRDVVVKLSGDRAQIRLRGKAPRTMRVHYLKQGKWTRVNLDSRGWARLSATGNGPLRLRVRARGSSPNIPADTASLSLSR